MDRKTRILVIDGQGGGLGRQVISAIKGKFDCFHITAIGTNANASQAMLKAGADRAATGENPVIVALKEAEIVIGPVGIVIADSMLGEVTEKIALAVGRSEAKKLLIPVNICNNYVVGVPSLSISVMIEGVLRYLESFIAEKR